MAFTEAKHGALVPERLVLHQHDYRYKLSQPQDREVTVSPKFRELLKHLPTSPSCIEDSAGQQKTARFEEETPPVTSHQSDANNHRARHVPIVVTQSIIESVLRNFPDSSVSPEPQPRSGFQSTLIESTQSAKQLRRPRHIPIVIPAYAQPHCLLPPTPSSSDCETLRFFPDTPKSCEFKTFQSLPLVTRGPTPPSVMSRPTTSSSRTSTFDSSVSPPPPPPQKTGAPK